jgi:hypothetical protein
MPCPACKDKDKIVDNQMKVILQLKNALETSGHVIRNMQAVLENKEAELLNVRNIMSRRLLRGHN